MSNNIFNNGRFQLLSSRINFNKEEDFNQWNYWKRTKQITFNLCHATNVASAVKHYIGLTESRFP